MNFQLTKSKKEKGWGEVETSDSCFARVLESALFEDIELQLEQLRNCRVKK
jgi:hypothetical protein